ncbi:S8 family peptidase [Mycoplasma sp. Z355B]|uniref:S8 family peptidase n=1 Tax=unclassified Mycoplasma TaxID=2683645 RepID=UPI003AAE2F6D
MNKILTIKRPFLQRQKNYSGGGFVFNSSRTVTCEDIKYLIDNLVNILNFWDSKPKLFKGLLVSAKYCKIVAKSNRISTLLKGQSSNKATVGAKYNAEKNKHIITYLVDVEDIKWSIKTLQECGEFLEQHFNGQINKSTFEDDELMKKIFNDKSKISKSKFKGTIGDVSFLESFNVEIAYKQNDTNIISLYDVNMDLKELFKNIGIGLSDSQIFDNSTVLLKDEDLEKLYDEAPYLIAMSTIDINEFELETLNNTNNNEMIIGIPNPQNEPTIGVIDTLFNTEVYFSKWVEYHEMLSKDIKRTHTDYEHGTEVTSIIVDGPRLNPWLEDNCGRFKVRHFGVATGDRFSSFTLIKQIRKIVKENKDIKVWNISLGSQKEINDNFISFEAAALDQLQFENDCIFIVAGTNKNPKEKDKKIGAPADSVNSLVVNSVTSDNNIADYSRKGPVLSFYAKPDVCYYGGSKEKLLNVCYGLGETGITGTSFAAPWITRKIAYLIYIIGLNKELAKALIIDSARGWNNEHSTANMSLYGHGIVPISINDILQTPNDEIKFLITDVSRKFNTYNYHFPIPMDKNEKYPFNIKAVMCYTTKCDRSQGVDYTNTELNIHFGRIKNNNKIDSINGDKQNSEDDKSLSYLHENWARKLFRKWDNVKTISSKNWSSAKPKNSYNNKNWGMEIKTNNRLDSKDGENIRFGVVVTLKELNGENRIEDFIKLFDSENWLVTEIDNKASFEFYEKIKEDIEFQ